jgi:hypothetical protein
MGLQFHTTVKNGTIKLPAEALLAFSNETEVIVTLMPEKTEHSDTSLQSFFSKPLQTKHHEPLTRDQANERR